MEQFRHEDLQDTNSVQVEEANGVRCSFENECRWEWDKTQNNTFQVVNLSNVSDANSFISTRSRDIENRGKIIHFIIRSISIQSKFRLISVQIKIPIFLQTKY